MLSWVAKVSLRQTCRWRPAVLALMVVVRPPLPPLLLTAELVPGKAASHRRRGPPPASRESSGSEADKTAGGERRPNSDLAKAFYHRESAMGWVPTVPRRAEGTGRRMSP